MDAIEFAREHDKMCKMYRKLETGGDCAYCPIRGKCKCDDWTQTVPIVEKWSKEHPLIRNVDHVAEELEKLGFGVDKEYILKFKCPPKMSENFTTDYLGCKNNCEECKQWWLEEYKEKKE